MAQLTPDVQPIDLIHPPMDIQIRPQSRGEQLADTIRETIRARQLTAGDFFGTLESIRQASGLARTTVSEAVKLLRDRGVLVVKPGRHGGLFVAKTTPLVRLRHTLMSFDGDPASAADAIELRESLEGLIARKAAQHRTADDIVELRDLLADMAEAATWEGFMQANWRLHRRIAAICPNTMAHAVYQSTLGFLSGGHVEQDDEVDDSYRAARYRAHADLVEGIAAGDEAAVALAVQAHQS